LITSRAVFVGNVFRARDRDTRWDGVIRAAMAYPYKIRHVAGVVEDEQTAREAAAGIYRARRHFGISCKSGAEEGEDGRWTVWFVLFDPKDAKAYIAAKVKRGEPLPYNVLKPKVRKS
jgi:hypothetical protein